MRLILVLALIAFTAPPALACAPPPPGYDREATVEEIASLAAEQVAKAHTIDLVTAESSKPIVLGRRTPHPISGETITFRVTDRLKGPQAPTTLSLNGDTLLPAQPGVRRGEHFRTVVATGLAFKYWTPVLLESWLNKPAHLRGFTCSSPTFSAIQGDSYVISLDDKGQPVGLLAHERRLRWPRPLAGRIARSSSGRTVRD